MILLDTDHVNVLKYPDHPRFASLTTQLNTSADQDIATTVITVEEQMRGGLAWINRSDDVRRQVPAYQELLRLFDFFAHWQVVRSRLVASVTPEERVLWYDNPPIFVLMTSRQ